MRIQRRLIRVEFVVELAQEDIVWTGSASIPNCVTKLYQHMERSKKPAVLGYFPVAGGREADGCAR